MGIFLSIIGFLGVSVGVILFVVSLFRKTSKRNSSIIITVSLVLFIVGVINSGTKNEEEIDKNLPVDQQIEKIITNEMGKEIDGTKTVDAIKFDSGIAYMKINTNANAGSERELLKHAAKLIEPVSKLKGVQVVQLTFLAPMSDQYGKTSFERGMFINMNKETLKKIQWDNFNFENIPDVANLYDWRDSLKK